VIAAALADTLITQFGNNPAAREGVAPPTADLSNGTPPSASVTTTKRRFQGRPKSLHKPGHSTGFGMGMR
jgi:hypothetical protein